MDEKKIKNEIRNLISLNKTDRAFELLSSIQFNKIDKEIIILNSQYNRIQEELRLNVISKEEGERRINQINLALLDISNRIDSTKSTTSNQGDYIKKESFSPKLLWLLLLPIAAILLYWGFNNKPTKTSEPTINEPAITSESTINEPAKTLEKPIPPKQNNFPIVSNKTYSIINNIEGKWKGASLSWDSRKDTYPMVSLQKNDPVEWRFDPVEGKLNTYKIINTNGDGGGKWIGASISWDSRKDTYPMVSLQKNDPVEWRFDPVEGKLNTYKIINTNGDGGGKWIGASISWNPRENTHPMVSLEKDNPVEWLIIAKE